VTSDDLRKYLKDTGVSQRELARLLDLNERTIRYYCAGEPIPVVVQYAVRLLFQDWPAHRTRTRSTLTLTP
jgi:hypothetical protein